MCFQAAPVSQIQFFKPKPGQRVPEPDPRQQAPIPTWSSDQVHTFLQQVKVIHETFINSGETSNSTQAFRIYIKNTYIIEHNLDRKQQTQRTATTFLARSSLGKLEWGYSPVLKALLYATAGESFDYFSFYSLFILSCPATVA